MSVKNIRTLASIVGGGAIIAAVALDLAHPDDASTRTVAGGSGDSATGTAYVSPVVPNMTLGATTSPPQLLHATTSPPATTFATTIASPTLTATPAPTCVNNGQCP